MEKHEYTFIRRQAGPTDATQRTAADAVVAVRFATHADPAIAVDAVMKSDDATCVISISAADGAAIDAFDRRIQMACDALGLSFSRHGLTPVAASADSDDTFGYPAWAGQAATSMA